MNFDNLIHLQVACLTRYANACLAASNLTEFERILRFVDYAQPKVDDSLDNALHVSCIEMLDLDGDEPIKQVARQLLSPWQMKFYLAIVEFYTGMNSQKQAELLKKQAPDS
jgi:hypothetical protein